MVNAPFIGRAYELERLNDLLHKKTASLVVVNGRRRVGKSRLIEEFAQNKKFFQFSGLAPDEGVTAQDQRDEFAIQLSKQTDLPELKVDDWSKLFTLLADKIKHGRTIVLFDEITWMADGDHTFLSKLKNAWDIYYKKNSKLIFIICGSVSAWIEKNIISSTGYFGRVSLHIALKELPLVRCGQLLESLNFRYSNLEKLMLMSLTGGVPWYIEQIIPKYSAEKNISRLCFEPESLLINEFRFIFHDLFGRRSDIYGKIVRLLVNGPLGYQDIANKLKYTKGSALTDYMSELVISGYVSLHHIWDLTSGKSTKLSKYRLSDNFLRFYFRLMEPKLTAIRDGSYRDVNLSSLPGWWGMIGLQFENLVLNNWQLILKALSINLIDVVSHGPYFQNRTQRTKGCQIDYLIQTKLNTLYLCEIRFSQNTINQSVIREIQERVARFSVPKNYSVLPVLIHCNEVSENVYEAEYFHSIIDFSQFLDAD